MLESDQFFALCVWLLSREGFSKGSFSSSNHPFQGHCKVCMPESDFFSLLCVCDLHQGKASARAPSHRSVLLIKGSARQGFQQEPFSSFNPPSQGSCKVCVPESDLLHHSEICLFLLYERWYTSFVQGFMHWIPVDSPG